jgi:nicotinate-nucleotide adenylyltransferase
MRVALFGGSFDPPHHGHTAAAKAAADAFELDRVLFAPVGLQPLKLAGTTTSFADRFAMVELVCSEDPRFVASDLDAPRADGTPNYTVETLADLREKMPEVTLFNLVGADSFVDLPRWHEPERLLELAEWIVVSRPGFAIESLSSIGLSHEQSKRVHLLETVHVDLAATDLRERLEAGDWCGDLVGATVMDYIHRHQLYRRTQPE